jgi:mannitol operon transcriptional antiterminator
MLTILNKKILLKILGEHNIDSGRLIKEYKITQRTFEYNIKKINELLEKINIKIENSGKNYYIKTEEERIKLVSLLEMTDTLDKADRLIIMKFILFFGSGINLQRLSEDLEISLTTVKKDLNFIKSELDGIEYRKNVGFILKKHKTDDNAKLILLEKIISNPQIFEYLSARYTEFFSKNNRITGFLEYIKKELDFKMTTENYSLLHTYILLILNTDKEEKNNNEAFIKETEEFKIINDYWVSQDILSEKNMIRIADLVIGLSVQTNKLENWLNEEILVKKIIKKFADYIELNIEKDQILYECLIYHLKPAILQNEKKESN